MFGNYNICICTKNLNCLGLILFQTTSKSCLVTVMYSIFVQFPWIILVQNRDLKLVKVKLKAVNELNQNIKEPTFHFQCLNFSLQILITSIITEIIYIILVVQRKKKNKNCTEYNYLFISVKCTAGSSLQWNSKLLTC